MSADIIELRQPLTRQHRLAARRRMGPSMRTLLFRGCDTILESDDADLARSVALDIDRAATKLRKVRQRIQGMQEQATAQLEKLTTVEAKLGGAIVAALLSTRRQN